MKDLLRVENLTVEFGVHEGILRAVDNVSFSIPPGGTLALVGESGSGKSVCSQAIMGLLPRTARIPSGSILFEDPRESGNPIDIAKLDRTGPEMRAIRGGQISIIFQEPMTSLSALHTVGDQIGEAVELHGGSRLANLRLGDQAVERVPANPPSLERPVQQDGQGDEHEADEQRGAEPGAHDVRPRSGVPEAGVERRLADPGAREGRQLVEEPGAGALVVGVADPDRYRRRPRQGAHRGHQRRRDR